MDDGISREREDGDGHPLEADQRTVRGQPHLQACHDIPEQCCDGAPSGCVVNRSKGKRFRDE